MGKKSNNKKKEKKDPGQQRKQYKHSPEYLKKGPKGKGYSGRNQSDSYTKQEPVMQSFIYNIKLALYEEQGLDTLIIADNYKPIVQEALKSNINFQTGRILNKNFIYLNQSIEELKKYIPIPRERIFMINTNSTLGKNNDSILKYASYNSGTEERKKLEQKVSEYLRKVSISII